MIKIGLTDYTPADKIIYIRNKYQEVKAEYSIGIKDVVKRTLMQEHYVEISFELNRFMAFVRSDFIEWKGRKYTLRWDHKPEQIHKRRYRYTLKFEAVEMFFQDIQFYYLNQGLKEIEWRLVGNPQYFLQIGIDNINRYFNTDTFRLGTVESTEIIDISFSSDTNVFNGFNEIAEKTGCEWYMEDCIFHLLKKVYIGTEVNFETDISVASMSQEDSKSSTKLTRIVALGSTRNIPNNYRAATSGEAVDAIYSKRLRIPDLYGDTLDAYPNMSPSEIIEGTVIFEEEYPKRVGVVEEIGTIEYTDTDEETGNTQPWNAYKFKDSKLSFNKEYILPGEELRLYFQSGNLNGRDFGIMFHESGFSDTDNSQYFEIVRSDDYGVQLPNDILKPQPGDEYVLYGFDIALVSDQYVPEAEQKLYETASEWLQEQLKDSSIYECPTIIQYFADRQMELVIGQKIRMKLDSGSNLSSRIMGYEQKLHNPYDAIYTVGDTPSYSRLAAIEKNIKELQLAGISQSNVGGGSVYIIRQFDSTAPSDFNVFSAKRSIEEFLSKKKSDIAQGFINFMAGLRAKRVEIGEFITGMIGGRGAALTVDGTTGKSRLEIDQIHAREELIVPKITFNCIDVISGDKAATFAFGTFKAVDTKNRIAELDLLADQLGTLKVNDICRGIFHNLIGGNHTEDSDDTNGFLNYAGFSTAYFTAVKILENAPGTFRFRYALQPDTVVHPSAGMNFYAYGNFTDRDRQAMTYETRYYTRRLKNVDTWVIDPTRNISMQDGLLEGLTIGGMVMHGHGTFQENTYLTGVNIQFTPSQIEQLQGKSAYNVSLSSYEKVVKMNAEGNISALYEEFNVTANGNNVTANGKNAVTSVYGLSTYIQAWKGDQELLFADAVDKNKYVVIVSATGCRATVSGGVLTVTEIINPENCFVDLKVNCEGNAVFDKRFSVAVVRNGTDGQDGGAGKYTELRYRSAFTKPPVPEGLNPPGWSLSPNLENIVLTHTGDFVQKEQFYTSPMPAKDSMTYKQRVSFATTTDNQVLSMELDISSETGYDWGIVTRLDTEYATGGNYLWRNSGIVKDTIEIAIPVAGSHFIEIVYAKDYTQSRNEDRLKYRFIKPHLCWLSTAVIDPNTKTTAGWSIPVEFPTDSPSEEQIYLLTQSDILAEMPTSDPYADEFIGEASEYVASFPYAIGKIVKYRDGYKICIKPATGIEPDNRTYWEDCCWWTDNPAGASSEYPYEYMCVRNFTDGHWADYEKLRLFMRYGRDGSDGVTPLVTQLLPSVTQIGRTMTGSYEPESFSISHKDTSGEPVSAYMAVWGSQDANDYTLVGALENVSSIILNVAQYPYKYFVIRTYPSSDITWEAEYLLTTSVNVVTDGEKGAPGEKGDKGEKGATGDTGASGAMPVYCGFYNGGTAYTYSNNTRDIINYEIDGGVYTFQVKVHGSTVTAPPTSATGDDNWEAANKFSFVAMDTALIDGANIAGFMYKSLMMISRLGTLDGVEVDIKNVPDGRMADFQPHIQMDGNTGEAVFNKVHIRGSLSEPFEKYSSLTELLNGRSYNWQVTNASILSGIAIAASELSNGKTLRILNNTAGAITFQIACYVPESFNPGLRSVVLPAGAMFEAKSLSVWVSSSNQNVQSWFITSRYSYNISNHTATVKRFTE